MGNLKGMHEEQRRSALKTISWRIVATFTTMSIAYIITGQLDLAMSIGFLDVFVRMPLYFLHERVWDRAEYGRRLGGTIESAIRSPPVTVRPLDTVSSIVQKMVSSDIDTVIVVDEDEPHGLITERDILERALKNGRDLSKTFAKDIMSSPVTTVAYDKPLGEMLRMMRDKKIRRLAVTRKGEVMGIVTERRILKALV